jgi:hypothetical protein
VALLARIYSAGQWEPAASAASAEDEQYQEKIGWEVAGRSAVLAGREVFQRLLDDPGPEVSGTARDPVSILA